MDAASSLGDMSRRASVRTASLVARSNLLGVSKQANSSQYTFTGYKDNLNKES